MARPESRGLGIGLGHHIERGAVALELGRRRRDAPGANAAQPDARKPLGRGVDRTFSVPVSWRISDLTGEGRDYVKSRRFAAEIGEIAVKLGISERGVIASRTQDYSKELSIMTAQENRLEERVLRYSIPPSKQFAFVALANEAGDLRSARLSAAVEELFVRRGYLKPKAARLGVEVFGNVDDRLYRAAA